MHVLLSAYGPRGTSNGVVGLASRLATGVMPAGVWR
jgi:hypothetical protein